MNLAVSPWVRKSAVPIIGIGLCLVNSGFSYPATSKLRQLLLYHHCVAPSPFQDKKPTREETAAWILSKFQLYSSPGSRLSITPCKIVLYLHNSPQDNFLSKFEMSINSFGSIILDDGDIVLMCKEGSCITVDVNGIMPPHYRITLTRYGEPDLDKRMQKAFENLKSYGCQDPNKEKF